MKFDFSQAVELGSLAYSAGLNRLDPADYIEHILRELGVDGRNIELAMRGENFRLPALGKCRIKPWQGGRGGVQDAGSSITWSDAIDLYRQVMGMTYVEACHELKKVGQPIQSIRPRSRPSITTERAEEQEWRFSGKPANELGCRYFCFYNKPISNTACISHGMIDGKFHQFEKSRGQHAFGLPVYSAVTGEHVSFQIFPKWGGKLNLRTKSLETGEFVSVEHKLLSSELGISEGIMASVDSIRWLKAGKPIPDLIAVKCAGPKDMLALWPLTQQAQRPVLAFSNLAGERSHHTVGPILKRLVALGCEELLVVHDCDEAGVVGALPWILAAKQCMARVRNIQLPFEYQPTKGKDLRDWTAEKPRTWDDFIGLPDVIGGAS